MEWIDELCGDPLFEPFGRPALAESLKARADRCDGGTTSPRSMALCLDVRDPRIDAMLRAFLVCRCDDARLGSFAAAALAWRTRQPIEGAAWAGDCSLHRVAGEAVSADRVIAEAAGVDPHPATFRRWAADTIAEWQEVAGTEHPDG